MKKLILFLLLAATAQAALTGTDRGTGVNATSATTFTFSPASNFTTGSMAVLVVAADNQCTGGNACATFSATDTLGNTWVRQQYPINNAAAGVGTGTQGGIFTTLMNGGTLTTGTVITITFTSATPQKAWTLMEITPSSGNRVGYVTGGTGTSGTASTSPTITTTNIVNGNMVVAMLCDEWGTAQTVTGDSDTSNGSWSAQQTNETGTTGAGQTVASQRKVVTGNATQTYNPTLGVSSDLALAWIELTEITPAHNPRGNFLPF